MLIVHNEIHRSIMETLRDFLRSLRDVWSCFIKIAITYRRTWNLGWRSTVPRSWSSWSQPVTEFTPLLTAFTEFNLIKFSTHYGFCCMDQSIYKLFCSGKYWVKSSSTIFIFYFCSITGPKQHEKPYIKYFSQLKTKQAQAKHEKYESSTTRFFPAHHFYNIAVLNQISWASFFNHGALETFHCRSFIVCCKNRSMTSFHPVLWIIYFITMYKYSPRLWYFKLQRLFIQQIC